MSSIVLKKSNGTKPMRVRKSSGHILPHPTPEIHLSAHMCAHTRAHTFASHHTKKIESVSLFFPFMNMRLPSAMKEGEVKSDLRSSMTKSYAKTVPAVDVSSITSMTSIFLFLA